MPKHTKMKTVVVVLTVLFLGWKNALIQFEELSSSSSWGFSRRTLIPGASSSGHPVFHLPKISQLVLSHKLHGKLSPAVLIRQIHLGLDAPNAELYQTHRHLNGFGILCLQFSEQINSLQMSERESGISPHIS